MGRFTSVHLALLGALLLPGPGAWAAGAVEMQVERIVTTAIDEYNQAMEAGDPQTWLKYFTDNARRSSPLGSQQGRSAFDEYYQGEFERYRAHWTVRKVIVMGRSAAVIVENELAERGGGAKAKVDMALVFELAPSGRFDSLDLYFDTAKVVQVTAAR